MSKTEIKLGDKYTDWPISEWHANLVFSMQRNLPVELSGGTWICSFSRVRAIPGGWSADFTVLARADKVTQ
jgi:hypothetical protein